MPHLEVKNSRNGKGIFATKNYTANQIVYRIQGTRKHWSTLLATGGTFLDNCFRISENYYISPEGYIGVYQNHSCLPNAKVVKTKGHLHVVAITHIPKGTEILIDYSTITASDDRWTMRCNCGTKQCRNIIRNCAKLPKTLYAHYISSGILPKYIARITF
jgi:hypothetical protein